jgi:hypothetical protein
MVFDSVASTVFVRICFMSFLDWIAIETADFVEGSPFQTW